MSHLAAWEQRVTLGHLGLIRLVPSVCWHIRTACLYCVRHLLLPRNLKAIFLWVYLGHLQPLEREGRQSENWGHSKRSSLQITWELTVQIPSLSTEILNSFPLNGMRSIYWRKAVTTSFLALRDQAKLKKKKKRLTKLMFYNQQNNLLVCALLVKEVCSVEPL